MPLSFTEITSFSALCLLASLLADPVSTAQRNKITHLYDVQLGVMSVAMHLVWLARPSCLYDGVANWANHHVIEPQIHPSYSTVFQHYLGCIKGEGEGHKGAFIPLAIYLGEEGGQRGTLTVLSPTLGILSSLTSFAPTYVCPPPPFS